SKRRWTVLPDQAGVLCGAAVGWNGMVKPLGLARPLACLLAMECRLTWWRGRWYALPALEKPSRASDAKRGFLMEWLIPVVMGLWAIWTWSQEREQERMTQRARLAALYVNPFLSACEDLQSRIYHILELDGLPTLKKRYPDQTYAEETLYLIVRYFGWAAAMHRYSPYAQDPVVTRLAEAVR